MSSRSPARKRALPSSSSSKSASKAKLARADGSPGTLGALFRKTKAEQSKLAMPDFEAASSGAPDATDDEDPERVLSAATATADDAAADDAAADDTAEAASADATPPLLLPFTAAEEKELTTFDLASKFGPCVGLTRIARWQRAHRFGLDPPQRIMELLEGRDDDVPSNSSLFTKLLP